LRASSDPLILTQGTWTVNVIAWGAGALDRELKELQEWTMFWQIERMFWRRTLKRRAPVAERGQGIYWSANRIGRQVSDEKADQ
jgi:hypothetical protein